VQLSPNVSPGSKLTERPTGGKWLLSRELSNRFAGGGKTDRSRGDYSRRGIESKPAQPNIGSGGDAMIRKVKDGYKVLSEKGKNLGGPYKTREEAAKRLKQVEYFKHRKG
jgi:hypothetical protein